VYSLRSHNQNPLLVRRRMVRHLALAIVYPLSAGCGFRLRSSREPIGFARALVVDTSNGSLTLAEQLRRELATRYNVDIVSRRTEAQVVVHLDEVQFNRIIVGFSGAGRPREIELRMALLLRIEDAQGSLLQPAGQLELRRTLAVNDAEVLSTDDAERFQRDTMIQDLLQQIMRRLGRLEGYAGSTRSR
jgi:outer membrane lipopolysaccharide assembly protein LptE/RlpB